MCAVCRATLGHWTKASDLEAVIQSSVAACKGCGAQVWSSITLLSSSPCIPLNSLAIYCYFTFPLQGVCVCVRGGRHVLNLCSKEIFLILYCYSIVGGAFQIWLSQMRNHTAACSKYQDYIEEGVRTTAQSQPAIVR